MNVGPPGQISNSINSFHAVNTTLAPLYTNTTSDTPPPSGPLYVGYDGSSPITPNGTCYFSLNAKELESTVGQSYFEANNNASPDTTTVTPMSGYSGSVTVKADNLDTGLVYIDGTYFFRFQTDSGLPALVYGTTTSLESGSGKTYIVTQSDLPVGWSVYLIPGIYTKLTFDGNGITITGPLNLGDLSLSVTGTSSGPWEVTSNPGDMTFLIVHDPSSI